MDDDRLPIRWILGAALFGAMLVALTVASQIFLSMIDHGHDYWRIAAWQLGAWGFWALAAPWALGMGARLIGPATRPRWWLPRLLVAVVVLTATHVLLTAALFFALQPFIPVGTYDFGDSVTRAYDSWWRLDLLIFAGLIVLGYGFGGYRRARRAEMRRSRLEAELSKAQLETLRLQIQPHFLMNTLNAIAALVRRRDHDHALAMVIGLSELLDRTLRRSHRPTVPLDDEMAFVRAYGTLQQQRFSDRLSLDFEVPDDCAGAAVPTFLLQPLVENAIRHGIGRRAAAGHVAVRAERADGRLRITVEDDGVGFPEDFDLAGQSGIGLGNIRSRLEQHYGAAAAVVTANREEGGARVVVDLPFEPAETTGDATRAGGAPAAAETGTDDPLPGDPLPGDPVADAPGRPAWSPR